MTEATSIVCGQGGNDMNVQPLTVLFLTFIISMLYSTNKATDLVVSSTKYGGGKLFEYGPCLVCLLQ